LLDSLYIFPDQVRHKDGYTDFQIQ